MEGSDGTFRYALTVEYDGSAFHGWQLQAHQSSAQGALERAVSSVANEHVRVTAAGRTDAGVHATAQVVDFATRNERSLDAWIRGTNALAPASLVVHAAQPVPAEFSARFSATARRYQYVLLESRTPPALLHRRVTWSRQPLDDASMHAGAQALVGEHDFSGFRAASCQSKTPFRCIHSIGVRRFDAFVVIDVTANAFLHHMVRNIASALVDVGRGRRPVAWVAEILRGRARDRLGATAPPDGLYLVEVRFGADASIGGFRAPPMLGALGDIW